MTVTLNGKKIEVKRVSESIVGGRRLSIYCDEKNLEALKSNVEAHGPGNAITITRDDGSNIVYENGYGRIDGIERTLASGEDDITRIDLNLSERAADESIVVEQPEAPVPEAPATDATETPAE